MICCENKRSEVVIASKTRTAGVLIQAARHCYISVDLLSILQIESPPSSNPPYSTLHLITIPACVSVHDFKLQGTTEALTISISAIQIKK